MNLSGGRWPWAIILAGGQGLRLSRFVRLLYGSDAPKQFVAFVGNRSLLQHTLDRVQREIPRERILTVIGVQHREYADSQLSDQPENTVIYQPLARETGPGILLPMLHIHSRDPEAVVGVFPSDHFVFQEARFMEYVRSAYCYAASSPGILTILGATPWYPEASYGWIEKEKTIAMIGEKRFYAVKRFWEKPAPDVAMRCFQEKCVWNTHIVFAQVATMLDIFKQFAADIYIPFTRVIQFLGTAREDAEIRKLFEQLPSVNFSRRILEKLATSLCVLELNDIYWSDWGDEDRIRFDIDRFGLALNLPIMSQ